MSLTDLNFANGVTSGMNSAMGLLEQMDRKKYRAKREGREQTAYNQQQSDRNYDIKTMRPLREQKAQLDVRNFKNTVDFNEDANPYKLEGMKLGNQGKQVSIRGGLQSLEQSKDRHGWQGEKQVHWRNRQPVVDSQNDEAWDFTQKKNRQNYRSGQVAISTQRFNLQNAKHKSNREQQEYNNSKAIEATQRGQRALAAGDEEEAMHYFSQAEEFGLPMTHYFNGDMTTAAKAARQYSAGQLRGEDATRAIAPLVSNTMTASGRAQNGYEFAGLVKGKNGQVPTFRRPDGKIVPATNGMSGDDNDPIIELSDDELMQSTAHQVQMEKQMRGAVPESFQRRYLGYQNQRKTAVANTVDMIIGLESGGRADAKNSRSSATGSGQFIESTWMSTIKRYRPDLTKGKSKAQILALRNDADVSRQMTTFYTHQNARRLQKAGVSPNGLNLYMAHHFGDGGAIKMARSDDSVTMKSLLTNKEYKANPHLHNKTLGQVKSDFTRRMGGAYPQGASNRTQKLKDMSRRLSYRMPAKPAQKGNYKEAKDGRLYDQNTGVYKDEVGTSGGNNNAYRASVAFAENPQLQQLAKQVEQQNPNATLKQVVEIMRKSGADIEDDASDQLDALEQQAGQEIAVKNISTVRQMFAEKIKSGVYRYAATDPKTGKQLPPLDLPIDAAFIDEIAIDASENGITLKTAIAKVINTLYYKEKYKHDSRDRNTKEHQRVNALREKQGGYSARAYQNNAAFSSK